MLEASSRWRTFEIPFAFDADGNEVEPQSGTTGVGYVCPRCKGKVRSRRDYKRVDGTFVRRHFFHSEPHTQCSSESWQHWFAKYLVCKTINSGDEIHIETPCYACHANVRSRPPSMDSAEVEKRMPGGRTPDVVGYSQGEPVFAVEILHTHKAEKLNMPWVEVRAEDILGDPKLWVSTRFKKCEGCINREQSVALLQPVIKSEPAPKILVKPKVVVKPKVLAKRNDGGDPTKRIYSFKTFRGWPNMGWWYSDPDVAGVLYRHYLKIGYQELSIGKLVDPEIPLECLDQAESNGIAEMESDYYE